MLTDNKLRQLDEAYMASCLSGEKLYGDDFSQDQINEWFREEEQGYYNLGGSDQSLYCYGYHALNKIHGYRYLPDRSFGTVLGIGSAYGDELLPVINRCLSVTIVEPSDGFVVNQIAGVPVQYIRPNASGMMPFQDSSYDLITCFGVLHHVPNVSTVIQELYRCLKQDGYILLREPIISMGDWRIKRNGLTKYERGIPIKLLTSVISSYGFTMVNVDECMFSIFNKLNSLTKIQIYNSILFTMLDAYLCRMSLWRRKYHPESVIDKLRPTCVYMVIRK